MGNVCNCLMVSTFFGATLLGNWDEDWPFSTPVATSGSSRFADLMTSSFRDLNSSAGISLHPLALLTVVLLKAL